MKRRPLTLIGANATWRGLLLDVPAPVVPALRVEVAAGRRLRIVQGDRTLLWARVAADHYGVDVRFDAPVASVLPPSSALSARRLAGSSGGTSMERWAHRYLDLLVAGAHPLHRGYWVVEEVTERLGRHPALIEALARDPGAGVGSAWVEWDIGEPPGILPLRPMSPLDSGRVKALTKLARDDSLPPVLLWWVGGLQSYVILDGHDRLLAGVEAGVATPMLALSGVLAFADAREAARRSDVDEQRFLDAFLREQPDESLLHEALATSVLRAIARQEAVPRTRAWFSRVSPSAWPLE